MVSTQWMQSLAIGSQCSRSRARCRLIVAVIMYTNVLVSCMHPILLISVLLYLVVGIGIGAAIFFWTPPPRHANPELGDRTDASGTVVHLDKSWERKKDIIPLSRIAFIALVLLWITTPWNSKDVKESRFIIQTITTSSWRLYNVAQ